MNIENNQLDSNDNNSNNNNTVGDGITYTIREIHSPLITNNDDDEEELKLLEISNLVTVNYRLKQENVILQNQLNELTREKITYKNKLERVDEILRNYEIS